MDTLSATHRVLYNLDLLYDIIKAIYFAHDDLFAPKYEGDRCSIAGLARVCKTFHEPALGQLWRGLPSLKPVLALWDATVPAHTSLVK